MAMKASDLPKFDTAEFLDSAEAIAAHLEEVFQDEDPAEISKALGNVARATAFPRSRRNPAYPAKASTRP